MAMHRVASLSVPLLICSSLGFAGLFGCSGDKFDTGAASHAGQAGASGPIGSNTGGSGGTVVGAGGATGGGVGLGTGGATGGGAGQSTGGVGQSTGGAGQSTGGAGQSTGGAAGSTGVAGQPAGGTASGGSAGSTGTVLPSYIIGADISFVEADEAAGQTYSDGTTRDILQILKSHGFNYIRLRAFVDPRAADDNNAENGFADLAHTIAFGKRVKAAGLGFLLDFHYSDNWADPGHQCVPVAWQGFTTITQLATAVHDYTSSAITQLIAGGARPDMVQIGNEITPGMLIHRCNAAGTSTGNNPVTGAIGNWANLGTLLKAGVKGVKDVDTGIKIMLHVDRGGDAGGFTGAALTFSKSFITNAQAQGVVFDVFGESCYQSFQGDPASVANSKTDWANTLGGLATTFPNLQFVAAEYGPAQREINDVVFGLPGNRGGGTFNWEPTRADFWNPGHSLFTLAGKANTATADLALYDLMKTAYASRL